MKSTFANGSLRSPGSLLLLLIAGFAVAALVVWKGRRQTAEQRGRAYDALILDAAQRHHVSPYLVKAIIWRESRFRPLAVGQKGEVGLMQITGAAVTEWHRRTGNRLPCRGIRFFPRLNIEIGTWYISWASKHWQGYRSADALTLAEYNAGYGNVMKYGWPPDKPQTRIAPERISFPGTREYIRQILMKWHQFEKEHRKREQ